MYTITITPISSSFSGKGEYLPAQQLNSYFETVAAAANGSVSAERELHFKGAEADLSLKCYFISAILKSPRTPPGEQQRGEGARSRSADGQHFSRTALDPALPHASQARHTQL